MEVLMVKKNTLLVNENKLYTTKESTNETNCLLPFCFVWI